VSITALLLAATLPDSSQPDKSAASSALERAGGEALIAAAAAHHYLMKWFIARPVDIAQTFEMAANGDASSPPGVNGAVRRGHQPSKARRCNARLCSA
jgi:hypothetical protein